MVIDTAATIAEPQSTITGILRWQVLKARGNIGRTAVHRQ